MAINVVDTKAILGRIYDKYQDEGRLSEKIIYQFLGNDQENVPVYAANPETLANLLASMPVYRAQSTKKQFTGPVFADYIHQTINNNIRADKRIILNFTTQQRALSMAHKILTSTNPVIKSAKSLKVFVTDQIITNLKYDKMVIYYDSKLPGNFISTIQGFLQPGDLNTDISAFYDEQLQGMGIGVEISGTSFTTERASDIIEFLIESGGKYLTKNGKGWIWGIPLVKISQRIDFVDQVYDYVIRRIQRQEAGRL